MKYFNYKDNSKSNDERGFVLVSSLLVTGLLLSFLAAYYTTTSHEIASMKFSKNTSSGFYAAEAGLNIRAEDIRSIFTGYNMPTGTSPSVTSPCDGSNLGSGDFICQTNTINKRDVFTYVTEDASNPVILTIPPGELYQNLNAQEYRYVTKSFARNTLNQLEANLELHFRTRLVPLFQFAAFYDKDLEILPGPSMVLAGPVHTNGDLYLNANTRLSIDGQVTTMNSLYRGRKDGGGSCKSKPVEVMDPLSYLSILPSCSSRTLVPQSTLDNWNGMIESGVLEIVVPSPTLLDASSGQIYWDRADLRLVMTMDGSDNPVAIEVWDSSETNEAAKSAMLTACTGNTDSGNAVEIDTIYNYREKKWIDLLDVDMQGLLNCLQSTNWFGESKLLSDTSDGGLVFHFTVKGSNSSNVNKYGVRLRNASEMQSNVAFAPVVQGITVVSDQAVYTMGHYNSVNKIPAAILADSLNVLSTNWNDANSDQSITSRIASDTTINSAFLAGTDSTGGIEGSGGQGGTYNGGLENYPRFHERWSSRTLLYRGSFVSLGVAQHVSGSWKSQSYNPPKRDWNYDTSFNNAANLPPLTPRFVYLKQELFVRDFNQIQ